MDLRKAVTTPVALALLLVPAVAPAEAATEYKQAVWFNWGKTTLDVLILEVHDPLMSYHIQRGMDVWKNGISYWNPTLGAALEFRVRWADTTSSIPSDYTPDIVWVPQGFAAYYRGGDGNQATPACVVTAPMQVGYGSYLRVTSHEFGHCLGQEHVFADGVEYKPSHDIMGDGDGPKCPSNLNVQVITRAFGGMGGTVTMSPTAYRQAPSC